MKRTLLHIVPGTLALTFASAAWSQAINPLGNLNCGQEGQRACFIWEPEHWETAPAGGCDHGLREEFRWREFKSYCVNSTRRSAAVDAGVERALRMQRELQADLPLNQMLHVVTHNAFNNRNDGYGWPNQHHSVTDQMRMGVRVLDLDIHWFNRALRMCHGQPNHTGCAPLDRPFWQIVEEIANFIRLPENKNEVLFVNIEDRMDGHIAEFLAPVERHLGSLLYPVSAAPAGRLPTLNEIRKTGKQVVLLNGNSYGTNVLHSGWDGKPGWPNNYAKYFDGTNCAYTGPAPQSVNTRSMGWREIYSISEDSTVIWPFWNGPKESGVITPDVVRQAVRCEVNWLGLDQLETDKLREAVFTWAPGRPSGQNCATMAGLSGRWLDEACMAERSFACVSETDPWDWKVTQQKGRWEAGRFVCPAEFPGYRFAVPRTASTNRQLHAASGGSGLVWINWTNTLSGNTWREERW